MIEVVNIYSWVPDGKSRTAIYIGRAGKGRSGSPLANQESMKDKSNEERDRVCDLYQDWLRTEYNKPGSPARVELLRLVALARIEDLVLICFCKPRRCHGDFIKHAIERLL